MTVFWKTLKTAYQTWIRQLSSVRVPWSRSQTLWSLRKSRALALECSDFACQCVFAVWGVCLVFRLSRFRTPNCGRGFHLLLPMMKTRGQLAGVAARLVMKTDVVVQDWPTRLSWFGVFQCAKHVDLLVVERRTRGFQRIVGYLKSTSDLCPCH